MGLTGSTNEECIWNYLVGKGMSSAGAAGLMGNLYAESALNTKNLQNSYEKKLGHTDDSYTDAVDNGSYSNFVRDSAGYGLAQWTYWSRKQNMLEFARAAGKSIGDLEMQLDFLFKELSSGYKTVLSVLKTATTVKAASDSVLLNYERPADQSDAVKEKRARYGQDYYDKYAKAATTGGAKIMTEEQARQKVIAIMQGWVGLKRSDKSHAPIIDTYNANKPLPRGYKVTYTDDYCATTVSAAAIKAEYTDIMPLECSCSKLIEQAKRMGIWQENDAYVPAPADLIMYDWQDGANFPTTDNKGTPDHVGIVEKVYGTTITIMEGNMSGGVVGRRTVTVNGRYIRGYICPKYSTKAAVATSTSSTVAATSGITGDHKVGDVVQFDGCKQYKSANASSGTAARSGPAKITAISANTKHPYHIIHTDGTSNVYGWVDAADIGAAT